MNCDELDTFPMLFIGNDKTNVNIRYLTGFSAPDDVAVLIDKSKEIYLLVSNMEYGRAKKQAIGCNVLCSKTLGLEYFKIEELVFEQLRRLNCDTVYVNENTAFGYVDMIESLGINTYCVDSSYVHEMRVIKRDDEIEKIAEVQSVTRLAMQRAGEVIENAIEMDGSLYYEGNLLTSEFVKSEIRKVCFAHNCIDDDTIVAAGIQACDPHETGHGEIHKNEWVVVDIFPRDLSTGYWGDMTRTFMNGTPNEEQSRLYNTVRDAQAKAISMVKAGVNGFDIHKYIENFFKENCYDTYFDENNFINGFSHSTGHGVGLEIHESPRISRCDTILQKNMVVTVEPGLYYTNIGGVRIEDTVVVQESFARVL